MTSYSTDTISPSVFLETIPKEYPCCIELQSCYIRNYSLNHCRASCSIGILIFFTPVYANSFLPNRCFTKKTKIMKASNPEIALPANKMR